MTSIKIISSPGNKKLKIAHSGLKTAITKGFRTGAFISGKQLVANLHQSMREKKSGKKYRVSIGRGGRKLKRSRLHTASAANETPAVLTGEFSKSIDFLVRGNQTFQFGSGANGLAGAYAKILEEGSSKMKARKPIGRTVRKLQSVVRDNLTIQINKQIRNLGF